MMKLKYIVLKIISVELRISMAIYGIVTMESAYINFLTLM